MWTICFLNNNTGSIHIYIYICGKYICLMTFAIRIATQIPYRQLLQLVELVGDSFDWFKIFKGNWQQPHSGETVENPGSPQGVP